MTSDEELIAALWLEVRPSQLELVDGLVADAARVREDPDDLEAWGRIRGISHRLAGTLGSFGQQPAGDTALALDRIVTGVDRPDDGQIAQAATLIAALEVELRSDAAG